MKPLRMPVAWALLALLRMAGCAALPPRTVTTTPGGVPIDTRHPAQGQDSRALFLILHYTAANTPPSIKILTQEDVSSHYLLSDESPPAIYRLVDESRRAWHSGPRLADEGMIAWPDAARAAAQRIVFEAALPAAAWFQEALAQHGYFMPKSGVFDEHSQRALSSFQMRYRPSNYDGQPDAETAALVHVLITPP